MRYGATGVPLVVIAGEEYGTGSARDWAAKGTRLLGVRAVIAKSFERIHRSNLVGMGVLPCELGANVSAETLRLDGSEDYALSGFHGVITPRQCVTLQIRRKSGEVENVPLTLRLDTPAEIDYAQRGGILPFVLDSLLEPT
jgi:aconitate hydratase